MKRALGLTLGVLALCVAADAQANNCDLRPDLCGLTVTSFEEQSDLGVAIDVVILGDGFTDAYGAEGAWKTEADDVIATFKAQSATGIYGALPGLYNFHVVDVISQTTDVNDADRDDTALGMETSGIISANESALSLAALNAPDVDVIVAVANSTSGRANAFFPSGLATGGRMRLSRRTGPVSHEMGHALFHLADEYEENSRCSSPPSEASIVDERNVTTDPTCTKFSQTPGAGCVEGGRYCSTGVFRSASSCLMRASGNRSACPVCAEAIRRMSIARRAEADFATPWVAVRSPEDGSSVAGDVSLRVRVFDDWRGPLEVSWHVDGAFLATRTLAGTSGAYVLDSATLADGSHTVHATVTDAEGRTAKSPSVTFETQNFADLVPPVIATLSPGDGSTVQGAASIFASVASDTGDLAFIALEVDGTTIAVSTNRFISHFWQPDATGPHAITVRAVDVSHNVSVQTASVTVVEDTGGDRPVGGGEGGSQGAQIYVDTPRPHAAVGPGFALRYQVFGVEEQIAPRLWVDGAPAVDLPLLEPVSLYGSFQARGTAWIDVSAWAPGLHALEIVGAVAGGETVFSPRFYVYREPAPRVPLPFIVSPHPNDDRLTGLSEFELVAIGSEDVVELVLWAEGVAVARATSNPARVSWDTRSTADGCFPIFAEAIDLTGRSGFSEPFYVCIDNQAPRLRIARPADGATVGPGAIPIVIESDDFDVSRYRVFVDGEERTVATSRSALYAVLSPGPHALRVDARDQVGLEGSSQTVSVEVASCTTDLDCDDGDDCTDDRCADSGWCVHAPVGDCCQVDADCEDADPCTTEVCGTANVCEVSELPGCCADGFDCSDGDPCTADRCESGACSNPPNNCCGSDADCDGACGAVSCIAAPDGVCAEPSAGGCCASDGDCDDGDPCTEDRCEAGGCAHDPTPDCCATSAQCDDADPCTQDSCVANRCLITASLECCESDADCGGTTACRSAVCDLDRAQCTYSLDSACCLTAADCDDRDPCTEDVCVGNACATSGADLCADDDGDGVPNGQDNCVAVANPGQNDADTDFTGDACDACPADASKAAPGVCGCGVVERTDDDDGDGLADCLDGCPTDPAKTDPGSCGCGAPDRDSDGDGTPDCADACPDDADTAASPCPNEADDASDFDDDSDPEEEPGTLDPGSTESPEPATAPAPSLSARSTGCAAGLPVPWTALLGWAATRRRRRRA